MRIRKRCSACGHELTSAEKSCPTHGTSDISFLAIVELGYVDGKRRRKKKTFSRLSDAKVWAAGMENDVQRGEYLEPSRQRLGDYLDGWLTGHELNVKPSTLLSYRATFRQHIIPTLGRRELRDLTTVEIRNTYVALVKSGLAPKTVRNAHVALRKALGDAARDGLLRTNPAEGAFNLKVTKPRIRAWGPDDLATFFIATRAHKYGKLFEMMAMTGLRRGEALGMTWSAVNLDTGRVEIEQTLIRDGDNGVALSATPKSEDSRRIIELDDELIAILKMQRLEQLERRMALGDGWSDLDLVWDDGDGSWINPGKVSRHFREIVTAAGLPTIPLHGLRHTIATLMIEAGESIKLVQEMLGHADAATTLDTYSHVRTGQQARATTNVRKRIVGE